MDVVSLCPFRAASVLWQPRRGGHVLTVVCKATFHLLPVESQLAEEQEYPNDDDNHWNDDSSRSLYSPADLVPFKPRADVVLVGHAFAPRKEPVRSLTVRLVVGEVNKAIEVFGERTWLQDGSLREGARFIKMPIRYERAAGGPETSNPVGMRQNAADMYGSIPVPNLQPPGMVVLGPKDTVMEPIGFGPVAPMWPSRAIKLGLRAGSWSSNAWSKQPLPEDLDPGFFNSAPLDQQIETLRDNERIILENLHPDHPRLVTSLPGLHPRAFVERIRGSQEDLSMVCDTLWIDTDRSLCTLTWRGQVSLEHPQQTGRVVLAMERIGQRVTWQDVERQAGRAAFAEGGAPSFDPNKQSGRSALAGLVASKPATAPSLDDEPVSTTFDLQRSNAPRGGSLRTTAVGREETISGPELARPVLPFSPKVGGDASGEPLSGRPRVPERASERAPEPDASRRREMIADEVTYADSESVRGSGLPFGGNASGPPLPARTGGSVRPRADTSGPSWLAKPQPPPLPSSRGGVSSSSRSSPSSFPAAPAPAVSAMQPSVSIVQPRASGMPPPAPVMQPPPAPVMQPPPAPSAVVAPSGGAAPLPPVAKPATVAPLAPSVSDSPWATGGAPRAAEAAGLSAGAIAVGASALAPSPNIAPSPSGPFRASDGGAVAASNAAAAASASWGIAAPEPAAPVAAPVVLIGGGRVPTRDVIQLLWFDPASAAKVRDVERWKTIFDELKPKEEPFGFDDEPPPEEPKEVKDRRDIFGVITRADSTDPEGLNEALRGAIKDDGSFSPPLVVYAGMLTFPFDELETAKATVTAATPLAGGDKKLKDTLDAVNEILKTPGLQSSSGIAEGLTSRVKEAFTQANRMLPATYLDTNTERMLLDQRHYQKRTLFGKPWIRAILSHPLASVPIPTYLPDSLSKELPMFQTMKVRIIAEVHPALDQYEASSTALCVVALGRALLLESRR